LADIIGRLKCAGAEIAAIPAVTPHVCAPLLAKESSLPLVSIVDVVRSALVERGLRRVALFGTRSTVETDMFGQLTGSEVVRPTPEEIEVVHRTYVQIVAAGRGTEEQAGELRRIAHRMIEREAVEAIILAGTELALLVDEDRADYPVVDCARLHIQEITRQAMWRPGTGPASLTTSGSS
jgi:aspartate racemase